MSRKVGIHLFKTTEILVLISNEFEGRIEDNVFIA